MANAKENKHDSASEPNITEEKTLEQFPISGKDREWLSLEEDEHTWKRIKDYALLWNTKKSKGIIKILLEDDVDYKLVVKAPVEFDAVANLLRIEKIVYYNIVSGSIATAWTPISETKSSPQSER